MVGEVVVSSAGSVNKCASRSIERVRLYRVQCWTEASWVRWWREELSERSLAQSFVTTLDGHNFSFHKLAKSERASFAVGR